MNCKFGFINFIMLTQNSLLCNELYKETSWFTSGFGLDERNEEDPEELNDTKRFVKRVTFTISN